MRRVMNWRTLGSLQAASNCTAALLSAATTGSVAYQYMSGRFASVASSARASRAVRTGTRLAKGNRCIALAK